MFQLRTFRSYSATKWLMERLIIYSDTGKYTIQALKYTPVLNCHTDDGNEMVIYVPTKTNIDILHIYHKTKISNSFCCGEHDGIKACGISMFLHRKSGVQKFTEIFSVFCPLSL